MTARPRWPPGVMRVTLGILDNGYPCSTSFWLNWSPDAPRDPASSDDIVASFVTNLMQYFLDVMHSGATVATCRLTIQGGTPWTWLTELAPNAGALSGGVTIARSAGVYVQTAGGGRGSGTRIQVPGIGADMVDPPGKLSQGGEQRLVFLADNLALWPGQLAALGVGVPQLGTLRTTDDGALLNPPTFDLMLAVRPSLVLGISSRRARSLYRFSPT